MTTEESLRAATQRAIEEIRQFDDGVQNRAGNRQAFVLCQHWRSVISHSEVESKDMYFYTRMFYDACKEMLLDQDMEPISLDMLRGQVAYIWDNNLVKYAKGEIMVVAKERAEQDCEPHPELDHYTDKNIRFVGLCLYHLAVLRADGGAFYLTQEEAGRFVGKKQLAGRDILSVLTQDDVIEKTFSGHTGAASEYSYKSLSTSKKSSEKCGRCTSL